MNLKGGCELEEMADPVTVCLQSPVKPSELIAFIFEDKMAFFQYSVFGNRISNFLPHRTLALFFL